MTTVDVLIPIVETTPQATTVRAARHELTDTSVIQLVANGKPKAEQLLELVADELRARTGADASVRVHAKASAAKPLTDSEADRVADGATLAVLAIGDCGACSACSIDDGAQLERRGVPSIVIITEPFQALAADFAIRAGIPDLTVAVVAHPMASRSDAVLQQYAASVAERILADIARSSKEDPH